METVSHLSCSREKEALGSPERYELAPGGVWLISARIGNRFWYPMLSVYLCITLPLNGLFFEDKKKLCFDDLF